MVGDRAHDAFDTVTIDLGHQHKGAAVDHRLRAHGQDGWCREAGFAERLHEPALARDVGRTGDAGAGRRQPQHRPLAALEVDPIGEAGMTLGDALQAQHTAAELALEVGLDAAHDSHAMPSRCAVSARAPTIRRSSLTRTTLMLV